MSGLNKSNFNEGKVLRRETHPLPKTSVGIANLVQESLQQGGWVERIVIQNGQPIQVYRYVDKGVFEEDDVDLQGALRNCEIDESEVVFPPWEMIGRMMQDIRTEGLWPVAWVVGSSTDLLSEWLGLRISSHLLGVPVQSDNSLPNETLILAGARNSEAQPRDVVAGFKIVMEKPREEADRSFSRGRSDSEGNAPRSEQVGRLGSRSGSEGWTPSGFVRAKLNGSRKAGGQSPKVLGSGKYDNP